MATTIDWPLTLPQEIQQSGYAESNIDNLIKTQMNIGPFKSRRRATEAYQPLKGSMLLTTDQRAIFYTFYKDSTNTGVGIAFGSLSFWFPEPGVPLNDIKTKITDFSIAPVSGNLWKLTMSLIVLVE